MKININKIQNKNIIHPEKNRKSFIRNYNRNIKNPCYTIKNPCDTTKNPCDTTKKALLCFRKVILPNNTFVYSPVYV